MERRKHAHANGKGLAPTKNDWCLSLGIGSGFWLMVLEGGGGGRSVPSVALAMIAPIEHVQC